MTKEKKDARKAFKKGMREVKQTVLDKKTGKRVVATLLILSIAMGTSACTGFSSGQMFASDDQGFFSLSGDAEGIRAYNDMLNGAITNTKASPDVKSSYWQNREKETQVRGLRFLIGKPAAKKQTANGGR